MEPKGPVGHRQGEQHIIMGIPEGEERKKDSERIFEKIMAENCTNLMKDTSSIYTSKSLNGLQVG